MYSRKITGRGLTRITQPQHQTRNLASLSPSYELVTQCKLRQLTVFFCVWLQGQRLRSLSN